MTQEFPRSTNDPAEATHRWHSDTGVRFIVAVSDWAAGVLVRRHGGDMLGVETRDDTAPGGWRV